jgi:hypothetical protein
MYTLPLAPRPTALHVICRQEFLTRRHALVCAWFSYVHGRADRTRHETLILAAVPAPLQAQSTLAGAASSSGGACPAAALPLLLGS